MTFSITDFGGESITGQHYWTRLLDRTRGKIFMKVSMAGRDFGGESITGQQHWTGLEGKVSITGRDFGGWSREQC